jgi:2-polyprenyl-6-methoxyphenol hydroxylase-like FAD-dependent oxidoreductase
MPEHRDASQAIELKEHAVVLGGGIAGMLAAVVLADYFESVMIIERHIKDSIGTAAATPASDRSTIPPAPAQILSKATQGQLERLFPGFSAELSADGAVPGLRARLQFSQWSVEHHLVRRLTGVDNVVLLVGCDAAGLIRDGERCVGARVLPRTRSAAVRTVPAELVVDAMGAGSRMCLWLADTWDTRVPIERLSAGQLAAPADTFTRTPHLRRRFDHAERLPGGVIALGDSLCSLGSRWGQSLNLALYHTDTLQRLLREETPNGSGYRSRLLPRRYFAAVMRIPCC